MKTEKIKDIEQRRDEHIRELMYEIEGKKMSDERLRKCRESFINLFVQVDQLKLVIIEQTSEELMKVFTKSPKLLKMIKDNENIMNLISED